MNLSRVLIFLPSACLGIQAAIPEKHAAAAGGMFSWESHVMNRYPPTRRDRHRLGMLTEIIATARMMLRADGGNAI
jgi:hypothetical protein